MLPLCTLLVVQHLKCPRGQLQLQHPLRPDGAAGLDRGLQRPAEAVYVVVRGWGGVGWLRVVRAVHLAWRCFREQGVPELEAWCECTRETADWPAAAAPAALAGYKGLQRRSTPGVARHSVPTDWGALTAAVRDWSTQWSCFDQESHDFVPAPAGTLWPGTCLDR